MPKDDQLDSESQPSDNKVGDISPEEVDDYTAQQMARDVANQVEETMQYPGQIKVTVIRETRAVEYAK